MIDELIRESKDKDMIQQIAGTSYEYVTSAE